MANLLTTNGANQDRYISAGGSGTDADPTFTRHAWVSDTGESGLIQAATSALRVAGVTAFDMKQSTASALRGTMEVYQGTASAFRGTMEIYQAAPSALRATAEVYQATASALQATVTQATALSGWTARLVTPSGDTAMDTGLSAVRTYLVGGSNGAVEARQSNASAFKATAEIYQAAPSALRGTMEIYQSTASALNVTPAGNVAHDAVDSGNPLKIGALAASAWRPTVADLDRTQLVADLLGRLIVLPYSLPEHSVAASAGTNGTSNIDTVGSATGLRTYLTNLLVTNGHATVSTWVNIKEDGITRYTGYAASQGGGFSIPLPTPLRSLAGATWQFACETSGADVRVSMSGYRAP